MTVNSSSQDVFENDAFSIMQAIIHNASSTLASMDDPYEVQNSQHNNDEDEDEDDHPSKLLRRILLALSVSLLALSLIVVPFCLEYFNSKLQQRARRRQNETTAATTSATPLTYEQRMEKEAIERKQRLETIEGWLVSKVVQEHDAVCDLFTGSTTATKKLTLTSTCDIESNNAKQLMKQRTASMDTVLIDEEMGVGSSSSSRCCSVTPGREEEGEDSMSLSSSSNGTADGDCPICYDPISPGDVVSWSPNPLCQHVFHHLCIKEWLLEHKECPFCRHCFLLGVDNDKPPMKITRRNIVMSLLPELLIARQVQSKKCFYCVEHKRVYVPDFHSCVLRGAPAGVTSHNNNSDSSPNKNGDETGDVESQLPALRDILLARATETPSRSELALLRGSSATIGEDGNTDDTDSSSNNDESNISNDSTDDSNAVPDIYLRDDENRRHELTAPDTTSSVNLDANNSDERIPVSSQGVSYLVQRNDQLPTEARIVEMQDSSDPAPTQSCQNDNTEKNDDENICHVCQESGVEQPIDSTVESPAMEVVKGLVIVEESSADNKDDAILPEIAAPFFDSPATMENMKEEQEAETVHSSHKND